VKHAGKAICHVPEALLTEELCIVAVKQNDDAFWDIPEKLRTIEIRCVAGVNPDRWKEKQDKLGIQWVKFNDLSDETQEDIFNCVEKVYIKFPTLKGLVREIVVKNHKDFLASFEYANNDRIELNGTLYKDITKLRKIYEKGVEKGEHPINTDYHSILSHEIGHAITWKISRDTGKDHIEFTESLREEILKESGFTLEDVAKNLSHYAAEDDYSEEKSVADEFIAEAFAEYMDSKTPRPIALKVGKWLELYLQNI
jgi:hypothetical protein